MGSELVLPENSWLEIVKAASNGEQFEADEAEGRVFPNVIVPSWSSIQKGLSTKSCLPGGTADLLTPLPLTTADQSPPRLLATEEHYFLRDLRQILGSSEGLSKRIFLRRVGLYLRSLKSGVPSANDKTTASDGHSESEFDERRISGLLQSTARLLGQRSVSIILECCIVLNFWDLVRILLHHGVVSSLSSSKLVQSFAEDEQPLLLSVYIRNVPDIAPQDVYIMLSFFLDGMAQPIRSCFQPVRREWRKYVERRMEELSSRTFHGGRYRRVHRESVAAERATLAPTAVRRGEVVAAPSSDLDLERAAATKSNSEVEMAVTTPTTNGAGAAMLNQKTGREVNSNTRADDRVATTSSSLTPKFRTFERVRKGVAASAIPLAAAVDGFSPPELCLHDLLTSGQDEAVLFSVVSRLSTAQVLKLTQYLARWIEQYSSRLENFPTPACGRVPSLPQVLSWASVVLEERFTQLVLSAEFHKDLRSMSSLVRSLVSLCTSLSSLGSMASHISSQCVLPASKQQASVQLHYVVELLDLT